MRSGGTRCHCQVLFFHQGLATWTVRTVRRSGELGEERDSWANEFDPQQFFVCWGKIMKEIGGGIVLAI